MQLTSELHKAKGKITTLEQHIVVLKSSRSDLEQQLADHQRRTAIESRQRTDLEGDMKSLEQLLRSKQTEIDRLCRAGEERDRSVVASWKEFCATQSRLIERLEKLHEGIAAQQQHEAVEEPKLCDHETDLFRLQTYIDELKSIVSAHETRSKTLASRYEKGDLVILNIYHTNTQSNIN